MRLVGGAGEMGEECGEGGRIKGFRVRFVCRLLTMLNYDRRYL